MKKFLGLGLVMLLFASCSDDDSSSSSNNVDLDHLTKKWYPVSYKVGGHTIPYDDHEECGNDYIEFFANGTVKDVDVWECEEWVEEGTYTTQGNSITVTYEGMEMTGTITKLTATDLSFKATYDFNGDGSMETITENFASSLD